MPKPVKHKQHLKKPINISNAAEFDDENPPANNEVVKKRKHAKCQIM
jgi:hypothetical protein